MVYFYSIKVLKNIFLCLYKLLSLSASLVHEVGEYVHRYWEHNGAVLLCSDVAQSLQIPQL